MILVRGMLLWILAWLPSQPWRTVWPWEVHQEVLALLMCQGTPISG